MKVLTNSHEKDYIFFMSKAPTLSILVVDDEMDVRNAIKRTLRKLPYDLYFADNGESALSVMAEQEIDILISDMRMPTMNGAELFSAVNVHAPHIFKVLLTGYADLDATITAINKGAIDKYLQKPWTKEQLLDVIEEGVSNVCLHRELQSLQKYTDKQTVTLQQLTKNLGKKVELQAERVVQLMQEQDDEHKATYQMLFNLIVLHPVLDEHFARHVSQFAGFIGAKCKLKPTQITQLRLAGLLCELGFFSMPDDVLTTPIDKLSTSQKDIFNTHVAVAKSLLNPLSHMEEISTMIQSQSTEKTNEQKVVADGSSCLRLSAELCRLLNGRQTGSPMELAEALSQLAKGVGKRFPQELYDLVKYHRDNISSLIRMADSPRFIDFDELSPGMVNARDISTPDHKVLLRQGQIFTEGIIDKLESIMEHGDFSLQISVFPEQAEEQQH